MANIFHLSEMVSLALHSIIIIAARGEELISAKEIADQLGASRAHLTETLQQLVKAGYIHSERGPRGGFTLAKRADEITLLEIYEAIEGPLDFAGCPMKCKECIYSSCIFGSVPEKINQEFKQYMENRKVSDCVEDLKDKALLNLCQCSPP